MRPYHKRSKDFLSLSTPKQKDFITTLRLSREIAKKDREKKPRETCVSKKEKKPKDPLLAEKKKLLKLLLADKETLKKANISRTGRSHKATDIR